MPRKIKATAIYDSIRFLRDMFRIQWYSLTGDMQKLKDAGIDGQVKDLEACLLHMEDIIHSFPKKWRSPPKRGGRAAKKAKAR